jgi:TonB family protein
MRAWKYLLAFGIMVSLNAGADEPKPQEPNASRHGYVLCAGERNPPPVPIYEHPCKPPVGELKCGEPIEVVSRKGPYFQMRAADGSERYIGVTSVSQSQKKFIAIDLPFVPWPNVADCSAFHEKQSGTHRPIPLYHPDPEYSVKARNAKISGSVQLSITVGIDGIPHDIVVTKSLGYGLDENAVAAVQQWKFDPAAEDGKPIPMRITVEVTFLYDK